MSDIINIELKRLAKECRIFSKSRRPDFSLLRIASSLESLLKTIDPTSIAADNPLSQREHEILELVGLGYTNKEIARAFKLAEKTIEYYLSSIFKKVEATTRTEAVANALKNKWLRSS